MPRIVVSLTDGQKDVWVAAAHEERVTLSEWVRRAADARAGSLEPVAVFRVVDLASGEDVSGGFVSGPAFPQSVREFRPDPKKK